MPGRPQRLVVPTVGAQGVGMLGSDPGWIMKGGLILERLIFDENAAIAAMLGEKLDLPDQISVSFFSRQSCPPDSATRGVTS